MNTFLSKIKIFLLCIFVQVIFVLPSLSIDLDSTVKDTSRQNYTKNVQNQNVSVDATTKQLETVTEPVQTQVDEEKKVEIKQDLPKVPNTPKNTNSSTVAPINNQYTGKMPNSDSFIPATDIKIEPLLVDEKVAKQKNAQQKTKQTTASQKTKTTKYTTYKTATLSKGTQIRAVNQSKITDYFSEGQSIVFVSTQDISTSYLKLPKGTKFIARVVDAHRPQMTCNGGLVGIRIVSVQAYGYNQPINGGLIKMKTDNVYFSNLKGEHTYIKNTCKKAKWGQNKFSQWSKTSHKLANKGPGVIIAPFPYIGGCILAAASTVSSPVTALLAKGGSLQIPANTVFTIKLYDDARLRY